MYKVVKMETETIKDNLTEQEKQRIYNLKWLSKFTPEQRKEYYRLNARERRGWKCSDCGTSLSDKKGYKTLDGKKKLCVQCTIADLRVHLAAQTEKKEPT